MPILIVLMFLLGIDLDRKAFANVAKQPKAVMLGLCGQIIFLPVIAFAVACLLGLPSIYFMGLVLVACCPGGSSSNVFSMLVKGDVALSVTLTALLSSIITLFTLPLIMEFVARWVADMSGISINLPVGRLLVQNILLLFLPLLAGSLFRFFSPSAAARVRAVLSRFAFPALMILALVFFLQYRAEIIENFVVLGLSAALLILAGMLCSSLLSRMLRASAGARRTIVIEVGMQNAAQAIAIASSPFIFNSGKMALPAIIYALLMNVILLAYVYCIRNFGRYGKEGRY